MECSEKCRHGYDTICIEKETIYVPKYMIEAKGKTLFEWSLISLEGYKRDVDKYVFIVMKDETVDVEGFILKQCEALGINNFKVILLDYLTDGQATTAMLASKYWDKDHALLIYNIDTYVEAGEMNSSQLKGDGFIPALKLKATIGALYAWMQV